MKSSSLTHPYTVTWKSWLVLQFILCLGICCWINLEESPEKFNADHRPPDGTSLICSKMLSNEDYLLQTKKLPGNNVCGPESRPPILPLLHDCSRCFHNLIALEDRKRATRHCFCRHCDLFFNTTPRLESHCNSLHNLCCLDYNKQFDFDHNLTQHQNSTGRSYCHVCERCFGCEGVANNH